MYSYTQHLTEDTLRTKISSTLSSAIAGTVNSPATDTAGVTTAVLPDQTYSAETFRTAMETSTREISASTLAETSYGSAGTTRYTSNVGGTRQTSVATVGATIGATTAFTGETSATTADSAGTTTTFLTAASSTTASGLVGAGGTLSTGSAATYTETEAGEMTTSASSSRSESYITGTTGGTTTTASRSSAHHYTTTCVSTAVRRPYSTATYLDFNLGGFRYVRECFPEEVGWVDAGTVASVDLLASLASSFTLSTFAPVTFGETYRTVAATAAAGHTLTGVGTTTTASTLASTTHETYTRSYYTGSTHPATDVATETLTRVLTTQNPVTLTTTAGGITSSTSDYSAFTDSSLTLIHTVHSATAAVCPTPDATSAVTVSITVLTEATYAAIDRRRITNTYTSREYGDTVAFTSVSTWVEGVGDTSTFSGPASSFSSESSSSEVEISGVDGPFVSTTRWSYTYESNSYSSDIIERQTFSTASDAYLRTDSYDYSYYTTHSRDTQVWISYLTSETGESISSASFSQTETCASAPQTITQSGETSNATYTSRTFSTLEHNAPVTESSSTEFTFQNSYTEVCAIPADTSTASGETVNATATSRTFSTIIHAAPAPHTIWLETHVTLSTEASTGTGTHSETFSTEVTSVTESTSTFLHAPGELSFVSSSTSSATDSESLTFSSPAVTETSTVGPVTVTLATYGTTRDQGATVTDHEKYDPAAFATWRTYSPAVEFSVHRPGPGYLDPIAPDVARSQLVPTTPPVYYPDMADADGLRRPFVYPGQSTYSIGGTVGTIGYSSGSTFSLTTAVTTTASPGVVATASLTFSFTPGDAASRFAPELVSDRASFSEIGGAAGVFAANAMLRPGVWHITRQTEGTASSADWSTVTHVTDLPSAGGIAMPVSAESAVHRRLYPNARNRDNPSLALHIEVLPRYPT